MRYHIAFLLFFSVKILFSQHIISSPDKRTKFILNPSADSYSVSIDGQTIIKDSKIGIEIRDFKTNKSLPKVSNPWQVNEKISHPFGRFSTIDAVANERTVNYNNGITLTVRVYNNGIAWRFAIQSKKKEIIVDKETAEFNFDTSAVVGLPRQIKSDFLSAFEGVYRLTKITNIIGSDSASFLPVYLNSNQTYMAIAESDVLSYPNMWLIKNGDAGFTADFANDVERTSFSNDNSKIEKRADYMAKTIGVRQFPWRIVMLADKPEALLENELIYTLATPSKIQDISWIKPGFSSWEWFNDWNIANVDFKAGINVETYKHYIDFSAKYGFKYITLDEGWSVSRDSFLVIKKDFDLKEVINYAKQKNVDVILWVHWYMFDKKLEEALDKFASWGIKGLKIDFLDRDDASITQFMERTLAQAAKRNLLIDFHGTFKETGLYRTYPNLVNREGILGNEYNKWSNMVTPQHIVLIPFTRALAGPLDFTPGGFRNAQPWQFAKSYNRPMVMGTRCFQMALSLLFYAPLQYLADSPWLYEQWPEQTKFLTSLPTTFHQTIGLPCQVGKTAAVARRKADNWYVAAINADITKQKFKFTLPLTDGVTYKVTGFTDGINAFKEPIDTRFVDYNTTKNTFEFEAEINGGFLLKIEPVK